MQGLYRTTPVCTMMQWSSESLRLFWGAFVRVCHTVVSGILRNSCRLASSPIYQIDLVCFAEHGTVT
jgi:hypothetical protein